LNILEKAKELGRELYNTEEYQRLQEVTKKVNEDSDALQLLQSFKEAQHTIQFLQQTGVQPTEEQIADYQNKRKNLESNLNLLAYRKATEDFYAVMKQVNEAISAGIEGKED